MKAKTKKALRHTTNSLKRNLPRVERKLRKAGAKPDLALAFSAAKLYWVLNKLAKE